MGLICPMGSLRVSRAIKNIRPIGSLKVREALKLIEEYYPHTGVQSILYVCLYVYLYICLYVCLSVSLSGRPCHFLAIIKLRPIAMVVLGVIGVS